MVFPLGGSYRILKGDPKKELLWSLWVSNIPRGGSLCLCAFRVSGLGVLGFRLQEFGLSKEEVQPQAAWDCVGFSLGGRFFLSSWVGTLYTFWGNITHYKTKSVNFWGLMNSATKFESLGFTRLSLRTTYVGLRIRSDSTETWQPTTYLLLCKGLGSPSTGPGLWVDGRHGGDFRWTKP